MKGEPKTNPSTHKWHHDITHSLVIENTIWYIVIDHTIWYTMISIYMYVYIVYHK